MDIEDPYEFELHNTGIRALSLCVETMSKNEKSTFKVNAQILDDVTNDEKIKGNEFVFFEIHLIDFFDKVKTKLDYSPQERY